jgi:transcription initiation factor TFIIIB Brf1 subunit/transcription initiation factor TFIIB
MMTDLDLARGDVEAILAQLNLESATAARARSLCESADWDWPINRGGSATAAGAVYLASMLEDERISQSAIADAAGCSVVSLRSAFGELEAHSEAVQTVKTDGGADR